MRELGAHCSRSPSPAAGSRGSRRSAPSTTFCATSRAITRRASAESPTLVLVEPHGAAAAGIRAGARRIHGVQAARRRHRRAPAHEGGGFRRPDRCRSTSSGDSGKPSPLAGAHADLDRGRRAVAADRIACLCRRREGRIVVDADMAVPGHDGVWACGDCAAIPEPARQALSRPPRSMRCAKGVQVGPQHRRGRPRASRRRSVRSATRCSASSPRSGASAPWRPCSVCDSPASSPGCMWRGAYLLMLPRLRPERSACCSQWMLEICFARDTVQLLTAESVRSRRIDELMDSSPRIRGRNPRKHRAGRSELIDVVVIGAGPSRRAGGATRRRSSGARTTLVSSAQVRRHGRQRRAGSCARACLCRAAHARRAPSAALRHQVMRKMLAKSVAELVRMADRLGLPGTT